MAINANVRPISDKVNTALWFSDMNIHTDPVGVKHSLDELAREITTDQTHTYKWMFAAKLQLRIFYYTMTGHPTYTILLQHVLHNLRHPTEAAINH
jgi:hypothetical protein